LGSVGNGNAREVLAGDAVLQATSDEESGREPSLIWTLTSHVAFAGDTNSLYWNWKRLRLYHLLTLFILFIWIKINLLINLTILLSHFLITLLSHCLTLSISHPFNCLLSSHITFTFSFHFIFFFSYFLHTFTFSFSTVLFSQILIISLCHFCTKSVVLAPSPIYEKTLVAWFKSNLLLILQMCNRSLLHKYN
jgi:hypothetical protein